MRENWYRRVLFATIGVWVGGGLALVLGAGAASTGLGPWWAGTAIGLLAGAFGGFLGGRAAYDPSMHDRLHGPVGVALFVGIPIGLLLGLLAYYVVVPRPDDGVASALFVGAVASTLGGGSALVANAPLWKATVQAESTVYASWSARRSATRRRRSKYAGGALFVLLGAYIVVSVALGSELSTTTWVVMLGPAIAALGSAENERTVEVRDGGLLVDSSLVAWDDLDAFELTDDALVLHRDSRWFERADRFDRDDVDDLDAAVTALERFVPRRES